MSEMLGTFALSVGAAVSSLIFSLENFKWLEIQKVVIFRWFCTWIELGNFDFQVGMEFWARWAHKALWHASLWQMHEVCFQYLYLRLENIFLETVFK